MSKHILNTVILILSVLQISNNLYPQSVFEDSGITIPGVSGSSVAWADYNLDGYMDFVISGYGLPGDKPVIYLNNAGTSFEPQTIEFPDIRYGEITWADFDNDNDPDILLTGYIPGGRVTRIYQNDYPVNDFTEISVSNLVDASYGSAAWGDYNNDGLSDFLVTGSSAEGLISRIYTNNGNSYFTENLGIQLTGVNESSIAWGDYDNDGDQDLLITGSTGSSPDLNPYSGIYKNNGDNSFTEMSAIGLTNVFRGSADWIDYDNDGDLDIFISGASAKSAPFNPVSKLYRNDGNDIFTDLGDTMFTGVYMSSSAWGDYDNDGDKDLLLCGHTTSVAITLIYSNTGSGTFSEMTSIDLADVYYGDVAWCDYDNDDKLDILLTGMDNDYTKISVIYHNLTPDSNIKPDAPSGLSAVTESASVLFSWNEVPGDETPAEALTYNILIGTGSGQYDVLSPLALTTDGTRLIPKMGNSQTNTFYRLKNPKKTTLYWRVQAIDNSYAPGAFAAEKNITFSTSLQASEVSANNIQGSVMDIHWIRGNGTACAVFAKEGNSGTALPVNFSSYAANSCFGLGDEIGTTGWFCVYNGTGSMVTVTGMKGLTNYIFHVIEYETGPSYYSQTGNANPYVTKTSVFTLQSGISLPGVYFRAADWGDYDNDGDMDIQLGFTIYKNMGGNNFESQSSDISFWGGDNRSWGDYDNDGDLDLLFTNGGYIYSNNYPLNTYSIHTDFGITSVSEGSSQWVDFDNDGDLDIILAGNSGSGIVTKIYRNNGSSSFIEQSGTGLPEISQGGIDCRDYNKDGFIDILLTGNNITELYRNNGNFVFTKETGINLPGLKYSSCAWGDYNSDGYPDFILTGTSDDSWTGAITSIYRNNGDNTFTALAELNLPAVYYGYGSWGDYDNDGDLDVLITGEHIGERISRIFRNDGSDSFTEQSGIKLTDVKYSCVAWSDFDNDEDLDILLCGEKTGSVKIAQVLTNELISNNKRASAPSGLQASTDVDGTTLSWNPVTDDETPSAGLTYNIKVRTSGGMQVKSAMASNDGIRRIAAPGNTNSFTSYKLKNLVPGQYFWSVQAIDNGFAGGSFSAESDFIVPEIQANKLTAKIIQGNNNALTLKWENGNGQRRIVFCKQGSSGTSLPDFYVTYVADPNFSYGDQIGSSGWFAVYNGRNDSATVFGLTPGIAYSFHVIEYTGATGSELYFRSSGTANPGVFSSGFFSEQSDILLVNVDNGSAIWGDYDNDNFLDILITGKGLTKIYHNNGDNTFTSPLSIDLPGMNGGSSAWGDYDNDGKLDILLTGYSNTGILTKIFHNEGSDAFTDSGFDLTDIFNGSVAWGDYDNDGYLDIILTGMNSSYGRTSAIYHNEGGTAFTFKSEIALKQVHSSASAWGDYDNDGDMDLILTGSPAGNPYSGIYRNNGDNTFTEQTGISLKGIYDGSVAWGDYDNDNDLDILMSGFSNEGEVTLVYRNNGDNSFALNSEINLQGISSGSSVWGDYDNDGDLDILIAGGYFNETNYYIARIYNNDGKNSFTEQTGITLPGVYDSYSSLGDYDNDGDLDILLSGSISAGTAITKIYRNNIIMKAGNFPENAKPAEPVKLKSSSQPEGTRLSWSPVSDDETISKTMTYNLRVGTSAGLYDICTPNSDLSSSGMRRLAESGNAQLDTTFLLKNLESGTYYWSVQAVDQGYMGGGWSSEETFTVKDVQAFFTFDEICHGSTTKFTDNSIASDGLTSWNWDFGDGSSSTSQNPSHAFDTSGVYNVRLVVEDIHGTKDTLIQAVTVKSRPLADFSAPAVCQGTTSTITNTTNKKGLNISSWFWDFGDGLTSIAEQPPAHGYLGAAEYTVVLKALADNGCLDTIAKKVVVGAYPVAVVTANAPLDFCKGDSVILSVPYNSLYNYNWGIDGTALTGSDSSRLVAKLTGSFTAEVINPDGNCKTTSSAIPIIARDAPPSPAISVSGNLTFCQGDSVVLSVTNTSGYNYQWRLNSGIVGTNSNQYAAKSSGSYDLVVTNTSGCAATAVAPVAVIVKPMPVASTISLTGSSRFCSGQSATLSVPVNTAYSYSWKKGTGYLGLTSNSVSITESGKYTVELTLDGCMVTHDTVNIEMIPKPARPDINMGSYNKNNKCLGENPLVLAVDNIVQGYTYLWHKNETPLSDKTSIEVTESANYYLEAVSDICSSERDTAVITFDESLPKPDIFAKGPVVWMLSTAAKASMYKWYYNGLTIPGATNNTYIAGQNMGTYRVAISNDGECFYFSDNKTIPDITGIEDTDPFENVKIYPNPTTGMFTIEMNNNIFGELAIDIFTRNGSKVLNIKFDKTTGHFSSQIDLSGQGKGMYLVNLSLDKFRAVRKVVVE